MVFEIRKPYEHEQKKSDNVHLISKAFLGIINHRNGGLKSQPIPEEYTLDFLSMRLMLLERIMKKQQKYLVHSLI